MFLRLVLVGMVAAMGVTLPSRWGCDHWLGSAGSWASSTLADWETSIPDNARGGLQGGTRRKTECPECRLARERARLRERNIRTASHPLAAAAASGAIVLGAAPGNALPPAAPALAAEGQRSTIKPIPNAEEFLCRIASALDGFRHRSGAKPQPVRQALPAPVLVTRQSSIDGLLGATPRPPAVAPPTPPRARPEVSNHPAPRSKIDESLAGPIVATQNFELAMLGELCQEAERASSEARQQPAAAEPSFDYAMVDESWICGDSGTESDDMPATGFATTEASAGAGNDEVATGPWESLAEQESDGCALFDWGVERYPGPDQSEPTAPRGPQVAVLPDFPRDVFGTATTGRRVQVASERSTSRPATKLVDFPRDVFATPVRSALVDRGRVIRDKVSTTISMASHDAGRPAEQFGHAIQLTKDAVYAWMSVLTKPGVGDLTRR